MEAEGVPRRSWDSGKGGVPRGMNQVFCGAVTGRYCCEAKDTRGKRYQILRSDHRNCNSFSSYKCPVIVLPKKLFCNFHPGERLPPLLESVVCTSFSTGAAWDGADVLSEAVDVCIWKGRNACPECGADVGFPPLRLPTVE